MTNHSAPRAKCQLKVDLRNPAIAPLPHFWETAIGCDHAYMLTRADLLDQVQQAKEELGFRGLRFHGIFDDDVRPLLDVEKGDAILPKNCDWWQVDVIYDALLTRGVRPYVELSFMPEPLISNHSARVFKYQGAISPPRSWSAWESFIEQFTRHLVKRYGLSEVAKWYFEVWNEPNLKAFWSGSMDDYFRLYDHAAVALKRVSPKLRVGGPATAYGAWVREMIDHCKRENLANPASEAVAGLKTPLDFISYHCYPTDAPLVGLKGDKGQELLLTDRLAEIARQNFEIVQQSGIPLEIHVTEWNSTSRPIDLLHDEPNQAAFIIDTVKKVQPFVTSFSYWCVSDVFEELCLPETEFSGGFGILTRRGIQKPAFHAFKFLHQLGNEEVPVSFTGGDRGVGSWCTLQGTEIHLLLWNYATEQSPQPKGVDIEVEIAGMEKISHEVNLSIWRIDEDHGDVMTRWKQLGSPSNLSFEELEHLRGVATLVPDHATIVNKGGTVKFDVSLPVKSATFIKITPRAE